MIAGRIRITAEGRPARLRDAVGAEDSKTAIGRSGSATDRKTDKM